MFKLILLIVCMIAVGPLSAQNMESLPDDPRISKGEIANGFKYYLIDNDIRKGYADFYLVRRVGLIHEDADEIGFNSLIGEMGVKGTRNFPDNTITTYFDELGLDYSSDFQILNGLENSSYVLKNIPIHRGESVLDSTLLILYNWAVGINLDEEEVEVGKRYYKNNLTSHFNGLRRGDILHQLSIVESDTSLTDYYMSMDEVVDKIESYKAKELRSFYYKWFSPERMALVVVGDIDKGLFDTKIKSLFQALPRFLEKTSDDTIRFVKHDTPLVSVVCDREVSKGKLTISFTAPPLPEALRMSAVPFVQEFMSSVLVQLMTERLVYASADSKLPFFLQSVTYGKYMESSWSDALKVELVTSAQDVEGVLDIVTGEIYDIKYSGFRPEEYELGKNLYYEDLGYSYDWRIFTPNQVYAHRCIENYLDGYSLASIELKKEYMDLVREQVNVEQFNMYASSFFRGGDNCVVTYTGLDHPDFKMVQDSTLRAIVEKNISIKGSHGASEKWLYEPFDYVPRSGVGSVVSEYPEEVTGAKIWKLSNGSTVIFKRTQAHPNKFLFEAVSKGGLTLMPGSNKGREYINEIASLAKWDGCTAAEMFLHQKNDKITLEKRFDLNTATLSGGAYSSDLETFLRMVNLHFTKMSLDDELYEKYRKIKREELLMRGYSPEQTFLDTVSTSIYHDTPYITSPDLEDFESVDSHSVVKFINERFANAANFDFIIVGDLDESLLKDMVIRYIATIKGDGGAKENWTNVPVYLKKSDQRKVWSMQMPFSRSYLNITLASPAKFTAQGAADMGLASEIIRKRVVREMKNRGYPVKVEAIWVKFPEEFLIHKISSVVKDFTTELESELVNILSDLRENGATSSEIKNARNVLIESYNRGERESLDFWVEVLKEQFVYGKDLYSKYSEYIQNATDDMVNATLKRYLDQAHNTTLILKGETYDDKYNSNR